MTVKDELVKEIELRLGGGMVDVELDSAHYDLAINQSLRKYRQRSSRAVAEKFIPIDIKSEQQEYQLPLNVQLVREVMLRQTGTMGVSQSGVDFEPFNAMYLNNMIKLAPSAEQQYFLLIPLWKAEISQFNDAVKWISVISVYLHEFLVNSCGSFICL